MTWRQKQAFDYDVLNALSCTYVLREYSQKENYKSHAICRSAIRIISHQTNNSIIQETCKIIRNFTIFPSKYFKYGPIHEKTVYLHDFKFYKSLNLRFGEPKAQNNVVYASGSSVFQTIQRLLNLSVRITEVFYLNSCEP